MQNQWSGIKHDVEQFGQLVQISQRSSLIAHQLDKPDVLLVVRLNSCTNVID